MQKKMGILRAALWSIKHPYIVIFLTLAGVFGLAFGMQFLTFKTDYRVYFSQENPQLAAFEAIQNEYSKSDNVLFIIEPVDGDVFAPDVLEAIVELTDKSWRIPYSNRVDSITNFQHTIADGDDLTVADLVIEPLTLSAAEIQRIRNVALNEPFLVNRLVSNSGHVAGVNVMVQLPAKNSDEVTEVTRYARELAADIERSYPQIKIRLTGMVLMSNSFSEEAVKDNQTLVPIMFAIVIMTLLICVKSLTATFCIILLITLSIASALGAAGWLGWFLTSTSAVAPIIILTLVVADCVHFTMTWVQKMRLGHDKATAAAESLDFNLQPIILTSLTTAIGFMSMNFSDSPPFRDLGNIVAIGALIAMLLTLFLLPALLMLFPVRIRTQVQQHKQPMKRIAGMVIWKRKFLLLFTLLTSMGISFFISKNALNDEFVKYFDTDVSFRTATDFLNENMGGIYTIEFVIQGQEEGAIYDPAFLRSVEQFSQWLLSNKEVRHVNTVSDTFKRLNKSMHADQQEWYRLPDSRELIAQYLLLYELSLPYGLDLNDQINLQKSGVRIVASMESMSSEQMLDLEKRFNDWMNTQLSGYQHKMASTSLMFAHIGQRNIKQMIVGTATALMLISFILIFAFRSIRLGLISLLPNLMPSAVAFGIWGLWQGNVGISLSVVTGITLGIVVDDTIHFISKYRHSRIKGGLSRNESVNFAFSTVGIALWVTSLVLVSGFAVLGFSNFSMNSEMGIMTSLTILIALVLDFFLLPPLLMAFDKK